MRQSVSLGSVSQVWEDQMNLPSNLFHGFVWCAEFDPENADFGASTSAGRDLDAGRADYLQVG